MKKIILLLGMFLLASCGNNDKDCNCSQQRYERKVVRTNGTGLETPPISTTEWEVKGNAESAGTDDCSKNGSISKSGVSDSWSNSGTNTYTNLEYQYKVTCQ